MLWTEEDVRRVLGMLSMGMSLRTALVELGLNVSDMVINLRRMARRKIIEDEIHVPKGETAGEGAKKERGRYTIFDFKKHMVQCRYPMGYEGQHLFCGDPVDGGKGPWCAEHRAVVFEPPRAARRAREAADPQPRRQPEAA